MRREYIPEPQPLARLRVMEEETQPLPSLAGLAAGVRVLTVWNIARNNPIAPRQAQMVYAGLYHLTGISYRGRIMLRLEHASREQK